MDSTVEALLTLGLWGTMIYTCVRIIRFINRCEKEMDKKETQRRVIERFEAITDQLNYKNEP